MHGHVHQGASADAINKVRVYNPGSLQYGEYAEMNLIEDQTTYKWRVSEFNKHYLAWTY